MYRFKLLNPLVSLVCALALLTACSADSETHDMPDVPLGTLDLIISDQAARAVKLPGDPGTGHDENTANWDRLVLMMVYDETSRPEDGKMFRKESLTKAEFDALPPSKDGYRQISLKVPLGKVYLYGLTYKAEAKGAADLEKAIAAIPESGKSDVIKTAIEGLTLTNDYAEGNSDRVSMFLSVASGYYIGNKAGNNEKQPALLEIVSNRNPGDALPTMQLSRLAAKLDVQWDAADAFAPGKEVKSVKVNSIALMPGNENVNINIPQGKGSGRLFPTLHKDKDNAAILMGTFTFENTTPISQRNGRMDLYLFPDGVSVPKLIYTISGTTNNGTQEGTHSEVLKEKKAAAPVPLLPGAWYKVNTHIKGLEGLTNVDTQTTH